ncbi:RnfABCDGE type electron transport complex subunit G [Candidatus Bipolaricaulota bacterium]
MVKERRGSYPIIFLTLVVLLSVVALTLVDGVTAERIAANKREAIKQMLAALFPEMADFVYEEETGLYSLYDERAVSVDEETGESSVDQSFPAVGYAFMTNGKGYGGKIGILVGMEMDRALRGIRIISHQETPGLGAKIINVDFLNQFAGLVPDQLVLARDGGAVDAITGATISSRAVAEGVAAGLVDMSAILDAAGKEGQ